jgi:RNA polymerase sigma factor (sigma-70 family)
MVTVDEMHRRLRQYRVLDAEVEILMAHLKKYRHRLAVLNQLCADAHQIEQAQAEIDRLCNCVLPEIADEAAMCRRIMQHVKKINNPLYRDVLEMHYLSGITMEQIAERLNYDISSVYRIRRKALKIMAGFE